MEASILNSSDQLLASSDLEVRRGQRALISGLSFALEAGQMALIVGPNGSGKTSLLRVLAGLSPASKGSVSWGGTEVHRLAPEQRAQITYRGHLDGLKKDLTVEENLDFYASLGGEPLDFEALLVDLQLADLRHRQVRFLSAGQRRRTGLAALKVRRARLWILDEPMTNLDQSGRQLVADWIGSHLAEGGVAVVATHQAEELVASGTLMVEL
ncbi:MAG: heme ABC exporter ATP-binding protein CcmA [Gammaproteobacteria bacterium]|nr:heme ABC exporter ATP-binding protein CcmA [Gammaproteobacteria bacterium]